MVNGGTLSASTTLVAGIAPLLYIVIVYFSVSPGSTMPGEPLSISSSACFVANRSGTLPTTSRVGSLTIGVRGSSDG